MKGITTRAKRELAKLSFMALLILGAVQNVLLGFGVGDNPAVRWGVGIPCVLALVVAGASWAVFARRVRRDEQLQQRPAPRGV